MITKEESIPRKSETFRKALDIFFVQFNDIDFFIEDEDQQNFYYEILRKLFPDVRIERIFPLLGKKNVIDESAKTIGNKRKIYIVDKDFDDLLGIQVKRPNLFYLTHYSIENYLIEQEALEEYIIEEKPKITHDYIRKNLNCSSSKIEAARVFNKLILMYILVQSKGFGIENTSIPPVRFFQFGRTATRNDITLQNYENQVELRLKNIDKRFTVKGHIEKVKNNNKIRKSNDILIHIPGKYLLTFIKSQIGEVFNLTVKSSDESFAYRLAKNNSFDNLEFLKLAVQRYIK